MTSTYDYPALREPNPKIEKILAGARAIFFKHGFGAATTDMVQQAAGVSKSTIYSYFPSKDDLFVAVVRIECQRLIDGVHGERIKGQNTRETLVRIGLRIVEMALEPSILSLFRIMIAEAPRFPDLSKVMFEAGATPLQRELAEYLVEAGRRGDITISDPERAARHLIGMALHDIQLQCLLGFHSPPGAREVREIVEAAVDDFLKCCMAA